MNESVRAETAECTLTVTITNLGTEAIRISYQVVNNSALPLYLCNQFWENTQFNPVTRQELFEVLPNLAHIQATANQVAVRLALVDLPISDGAKIFFLPCLTRLAAAQQHVAHLDLVLPLIPYGQLAQPVTMPPIELALHVELGYFIGDTLTEKYMDEVTTTQGLAYTLAPFEAHKQLLITTKSFEKPVPVVEKSTATRVPWN
ncbi:MAG: hypothetical protein EOO61_17060 [Hymenobacter sp.]|nr:MAG: hypothetical protein EOO61_17060 [Hymenobacter sp.]